jgi:hypothetical protein
MQNLQLAIKNFAGNQKSSELLYKKLVYSQYTLEQ